MEDIEQIEEYERQLGDLVLKMRKDGITPDTIKFILQETAKNVGIIGYAETWLKERKEIV